MNRRLDLLILPFATLSLLLSGAIFGFFYAWICSTMWGLDALDPQTAIAAMQAMNASVRNAVFAPAFFGTGPALLVTAVLCFVASRRAAGRAFALGGVVYLLGGMSLTIVVNVPMNEALALVVIPDDTDAARAIWAEYSQRWQVWNTARTCLSGVALLAAGWGIWELGKGT